MDKVVVEMGFSSTSELLGIVLSEQLDSIENSFT